MFPESGEAEPSGFVESPDGDDEESGDIAPSG
jgi:hypothetical protein